MIACIELHESRESGVLAVHWLVHVTTALLWGSIVKTSLRSQGTERSAVGQKPTALLWLASRYVLLNNYNGFETGCVLLLYASSRPTCRAPML
jgi:hypothetical protein